MTVRIQFGSVSCRCPEAKPSYLVLVEESVYCTETYIEAADRT